MGRKTVSPGAEAIHSLAWSLLFGGWLGSSFQSGPLARAADPVLLLLLVEAATLADAVLAIHNFRLGVEEGEGRAAAYAEVLREPLVLGESGTLLTRLLTHLTVFSSTRIWCLNL